MFVELFELLLTVFISVLDRLLHCTYVLLCDGRTIMGVDHGGDARDKTPEFGVGER